ncbi:trithorax group protein osa [Ixodes scapularis]
MSAQPPKPEAENAEPAPPADAVGSGTKGREFPDFAADDPEPGDWIAPGEVLKQEPITIASDTTVPKTNAPSKSTAKDSVEKDGTDKEMPDNTEFIVKDEIVSEEGDGATKTEKSSYFCETCQETSPGTEEEHLEGRRHLKTQERLEKYGSLEKIAVLHSLFLHHECIEGPSCSKAYTVSSQARELLQL